MEKIERYGITLKRLSKNKIEMLRNWRNDPKISQHMEYRAYITPEMQEKWFKKINNKFNYYFIVEYQGREIGMVNLKDLDYEKKTAESGLFIYEDEFLNTMIPFRISLSQLDFLFDDLKFDIQTAHVLKSNKRAIKYNLFLGAILSTNQENIENQLYFLTKENYYAQREKIKKILHLSGE